MRRSGVAGKTGHETGRLIKRGGGDLILLRYIQGGLRIRITLTRLDTGNISGERT